MAKSLELQRTSLITIRILRKVQRKRQKRCDTVSYKSGGFLQISEEKVEKLDKTGYEEMFDKIENGTFMPKIVVKDNGVIPMQVNRSELKAILKNASTYLEFLNKKDENGIS